VEGKRKERRESAATRGHLASNYSLENKFGDSDDGSRESLQARKVALLVSKSILSLSSFAGISWVLLSSHLLHIWSELKLSKVVLLKFRWKEDPCVCSGFVTRRTDNTGTSMILTSATLVRSLNGDNSVISDVTVIAALNPCQTFKFILTN
jgi:hypothetical protein